MNWRLRGGSNTLAGTIPITADNVRPNGWAYVAEWGSDVYGDGSRLKPFASIQAGLAVASYIVLTGTVRGISTRAFGHTVAGIIGDGHAVIDGYSFSTPISSNNITFQNLTIQGYQSIAQGANTGSFRVENCLIKDVARIFFKAAQGELLFKNNIVLDSSGDNLFPVGNALDTVSNNTFIRCSNIRLADAGATDFSEWKNIFYNCNITFPTSSRIVSNYNCYYLCNFRFNATTTAGGSLYPSISPGFVYCATIQELRAAAAAAGVTLGSNFANSRIIDPIFNDFANGDYSLTRQSIPRNMGLDGRFIGAKGVAVKQSLSDVIYSENIIFENGAAYLADTSQNGVIRFAIQDLGAEYPLAAPNITGIIADRNGEAFTTIRNMAENTIAAGEALTPGKAYYVEDGTINYNSQMYNVGSRLFAVAEAASFTTTENGRVREITQQATVYSVRIKVHRSIGTPEHFETLPWHLYEIGKKMTANRVGDVGTGAIIRGNADPAFDPTPSKVLNIFARYRQLEIIVRHNNLPSV